MIVTGQLLLEADEAVRLAPGFVRIEDGVFAEVVEGEVPASADLGGPECLIAPGFVDTHLHLPQFDMIGAHGRPLLEWLDEFTFPSEARWADPGYAASMTKRVARQLLSHGTTAVCAYGSVHAEATEAACSTLEAAGLRGWVGQALSDRNTPDRVRREPAELLDQTVELLVRRPARSTIAAAITPRFAISCSESLLAGLGGLASEHPEALIQTHLSENRAECEFLAELFPGRTYVDAYADHGLLTDRTLLGHGIWLSDAERRRLADACAVVVHCPTANSFLRSGAMKHAELRAAGVRVSLGSDIGAGYERSMVRVARAMIETAAALGDAYPTAAQGWRQITAGNADAARLDAGRLRVGSPGDLLVIRPDIPWREHGDPLAMLLFAWDDRWVERTLTGGVVR